MLDDHNKFVFSFAYLNNRQAERSGTSVFREVEFKKIPAGQKRLSEAIEYDLVDAAIKLLSFTRYIRSDIRNACLDESKST